MEKRKIVAVELGDSKARVWLDNGDELDGITWLEAERITPNWDQIVKMAVFVSGETKRKDKEPKVEDASIGTVKIDSQTWKQVDKESFNRAKYALDNARPYWFKGDACYVLAIKQDRKGYWVDVECAEPGHVSHRTHEVTFEVTKVEHERYTRRFHEMSKTYLGGYVYVVSQLCETPDGRYWVTLQR